MGEEEVQLEARVRELLGQMREERKRAMYARLACTALILLILGVFALKTYNRIKNFDVDTFVAVLQVEGTKRVWPVVSDELDKVAEAAVPALADAFAAEAAELGPRLQEELAKESEVLVTHLQDRLAASLDQALVEADLASNAKVAERFPSFKDDPEAMAELNEQLLRASREWAHRQLDTTFADHFHILESINETYYEMEGVAREEIEAGKTPASLEDVLTLFLEIINLRLNEGQIE